MRHSTETLVRPELSLAEKSKSFRLNKVTVEHGSRTSSKGEMVPFNLGLEDGRDTELYVGINPNSQSTSSEAEKQYKQSVAAIPTERVDQAAAMLYEAYEHIKDTGEAINQPAAFLINKDGDVAWSADSTAATTGLVLLRGDGTAEHLGASDDKFGVLTNLTAKDMLYMAPNSLIGAMQDTDQFDKEGLKAAFTDREEQNEMLRVRFNEAVMNTAEDFASARAEKNLRKYGERHPVGPKPADSRTANGGAIGEDSLSLETAAQSATIGNEQLTEVSTLGFSEMVRLATQVEKYAQKVASYEELATEALARRMKGRLFKAPQYKTQAEKATELAALKDSGKENTFGTKLSQMKDRAMDKVQAKSKKDAKLDDDYMYLLEGFSRALDGALMKQWLAEGHSDDEVAKMLYEHQQTRQEARAARNHAELRKGKLASYLDKYANMPKGKKIAVTIGAGAVVGAVGLVAGGALGVAGAVGLATAKVGKTYLQQRSKLYEEKRDETLPGPDRSVSVANGRTSTSMSAAEQVFAGRKYDETKRERAIKDADRNKKLAVGLTAVSAVALGAGAAMKIAEHSDDIQKFWNKPPAPKIPVEVGVADGDWVAPQEAAPAQPNLPAMPEFTPVAQTINIGEGWLQTFSEAGVTNPSQQYGLLNNQALMQELARKGLAYPDARIGGWGINMTADGKMPADALKLIRESASRNGYDLAS